MHKTDEDFSHDGDLIHTFVPVDNIRQTTTFDIDIVNDDEYEQHETFIAVVTVTRIANEFDFLQSSPNLRLFTRVEILIDPNAPDSELTYMNCILVTNLL